MGSPELRAETDQALERVLDVLARLAALGKVGSVLVVPGADATMPPRPAGDGAWLQVASGPESAANPDNIQERRWWTLAELAATSQTVCPAELTELVRDILASGSPLASIVQAPEDRLLIVLSSVFDPRVCFGSGRGVRAVPGCARVRAGSDRAGRVSFRVAVVADAGQVSAGRAQSRCQHSRKASAQGQLSLMARVRWRAWRASRAGRCQTR
jgi:hypothetical protein